MVSHDSAKASSTKTSIRFFITVNTGQVVMNDKCCQGDQYMPFCCQLDILTIATMIHCLFHLRSAQKHFLEDLCSKEHGVYAESFSQTQPLVSGMD